MNAERYLLEVNNSDNTYEFYSEGPKGRIKKVVRFKRIIESEKIFNIGFGDWDDENNQINDLAISNNNDREKVLATVAATVLDFIKHYPDALIYAEGVTASRTRLYQMGILANYAEIRELFDIYGYKEQALVPFATGKNFEAFIAKRKEK